MATARLMRMGGRAALAGGVLWVVALGAVRLLSFDLTAVLLLPALLFALGLGALHVRQDGRSGLPGLAGFVVALVGVLLLAYGSIGRADVRGEILGLSYGPLGFGGVALGSLVFGIGVALAAGSAIAADVLPRLSPVPLLVGSMGVALAGGLTLLRDPLGGSAAEVLGFELVPLGVLWVTFGAGWAWVGYLLWSDRTADGSVR